MSNLSKPTPWPYRLWPVSALWHRGSGIFGQLKRNNWEWSRRLQLPLWLRLLTWVDADQLRVHRLGQKYTEAQRSCPECGSAKIPIHAEFCCWCGEELYDD